MAKVGAYRASEATSFATPTHDFRHAQTATSAVRSHEFRRWSTVKVVTCVPELVPRERQSCPGATQTIGRSEECARSSNARSVGSCGQRNAATLCEELDHFSPSKLKINLSSCTANFDSPPPGAPLSSVGAMPFSRRTRWRHIQGAGTSATGGR